VNSEKSRPNADQIKLWNELAGPSWVALQESFDAELEPLGLATMDRANVVAGEYVLDVGCGTGQATMELARRVGDGGSVMGVDISVPMLDRGRSRASEAGITNIAFENADAQTYDFVTPRFDLLFSRFGVMFFDDPRLAFSNLRSALRPGGRLAFACWRDPGDNPWATVALDAVEKHVPVQRPKPGVPGPFGFAESEYVAGILDRAGFANVDFEEMDGKITLGGGGSLDETVAHILKFGVVAGALREAKVEDTTEIATSIREAVEPYASTDGVRMDSAAWIVTARSD
jgi:SAM-dependent methyltransferase